MVWTALGGLVVGVSAACSGAANSPSTPTVVTAGPDLGASSPAQLGPGVSVGLSFDATYALNPDALGRIDATACGDAHRRWQGTATLDDDFIDENTKPVAWNFDSNGKAQVDAGWFDYELSSGPHYVLFKLDLRLVEASGSDPAIIVDRVVPVQPGFGVSLVEESTVSRPFPVALGQVPGC